MIVFHWLFLEIINENISSLIIAEMSRERLFAFLTYPKAARKIIENQSMSLFCT
jgi:hypothetical protein